MLENFTQLTGDKQHLTETFGRTGELTMAAKKKTNLDKILEERGNQYGEFSGHARITQNIKRAMVDSPNWSELTDDKKEALEMVAHKIGRILNGNPDFRDSWEDIEGYTHLVTDTIPEPISK